MLIFMISIIIGVTQRSIGQRLYVADTYMVRDETGRITCQINREGFIYSNVRWLRVRAGEITTTNIYTYWPNEAVKKYPEDDLVGRSDYEHHSNGTSTLVIHEVRETDQANYTCQVDFGGFVKQARCQVFVVRRLTAPIIRVSSTAITEGESAVFTCASKESSETILQYVFRRTDGQMSGNINQEKGRLTIYPTIRNDQGDYSCQVTNVAGPSPWSSDVRLEVDYSPDSVSISGYSNGTALYSDDDVTLICTATGGRPHAESVRWNCVNEGDGDGTANPGGRQNSFTAKVKKSWHGQLCSCSAWQRRNQGPFSTSVFFTVSWPPTGPALVFDPSLPWLESNTYRTTCQLSEEGNPASTYSWFKDNQNLIEPPGAATISLPVTKSDNSKEIKCEVQNQHTLNRPPQQPVQAKHNLDVQFAPSVSLTPDGDEITKKEDEDLTLECSSYSNPVAHDQHYKWIHQRGGSTVRERPGQKTWTLRPVKKDTAGTYRCEVAIPITHPESKTLSGNKQTTLVVQYLHLNTPRPTQEVTEYEQVTLTCTADAIPAETVQFLTWIHSNRGVDTPLNSNFSNQSIAVLQFTSIQYYNTGNYTCKARNDQYPEKMADQHVRVRYTAKQPDHPVDGKIVFTSLGQDVSLSITVDAYPTSVIFIWYYVQGDNIIRVQEDERTTITSQPLQSTLNITNITMAYLSNYTVHAENGVRSGSNFSYMVIPRDAPGQPEIDVTRSFSTAVSVEIWWRSNFDGGYAQTFSVHYRQVGQDFLLFRSGIPDQGHGLHHHTRVTPLTSGTAYEFKVEAHNEHNGGSTATSSIVQIYTFERPQVNNYSFVSERHGSRAFLAWERPGGVYDTQRIEQRDTTGQRQRRSTEVCTPPTCQVSENLTVDTTSYNVTGLIEGRTYQFVLVLFYEGDEVQRQGFMEDVKRDHIPNDVNTGAIVGGVIGCLLVTALISSLVLIYFRRRKKELKESGLCKMPEAETTTEIRPPDKAYELLNRPTEYENVKMSTSDEDKTYQELQKPTHYENVGRKNTSQEQTYEELSRPTNASTNGKTPQASASMDEGGATYEKLQYNN